MARWHYQGDINLEYGGTFMDLSEWKLCLVDALHRYGYGDTDKSETVQPCPDCPTKFDGWQATRIRSNGLRAYVRREFLGLTR